MKKKLCIALLFLMTIVKGISQINASSYYVDGEELKDAINNYTLLVAAVTVNANTANVELYGFKGTHYTMLCILHPSNSYPLTAFENPYFIKSYGRPNPYSRWRPTLGVRYYLVPYTKLYNGNYYIYYKVSLADSQASAQLKAFNPIPPETRPGLKAKLGWE